MFRRLFVGGRQCEGPCEHLPLGVEKNKLGPRQPAHLLQHRLGEREVRLCKRCHDAPEAVFLRLPLPHRAVIAARPAGQHDGQHNHGQHGNQQLDLNRPAHEGFLSFHSTKNAAEMSNRGILTNLRGFRRLLPFVVFPGNPLEPG